jgi:hypothetical protein
MNQKKITRSLQRSFAPILSVFLMLVASNASVQAANPNQAPIPPAANRAQCTVSILDNPLVIL